MRPVLALAAVLLVVGCGSDPQPEPQALTQEQACARAEQVTDTYQEALGDAGSAEDARAVIEGAITGLRGIETEAAVGERIDQLAEALADLLESVEAGTPPEGLQPRAAQVGTTSTALAQACGRAGQ